MIGLIKPLRKLAVALGTAALASCVGPVGMPQMPELQRFPTADELQKMQQETGGKAPLVESVAPGGIQVVFQTGHAGIISSVALSDDGRYALSASSDETAKLWDVANGRELRTVNGIAIGGSVAFVRGAERFLVLDKTGGRLVDFATGRTLRELGGFGSLAVSADGRHAAIAALLDDTGRRRATVEQRTALSIVDLTRDEVIATLTLPALATPLAVSNDASVLLVRRMDLGQEVGRELEWQTELWDVAARKLRTVFESGDGAAVAFYHDLSADGRLYAASSLGKVRIYRTADGIVEREILTGDALTAGSVRFSPDGRLLASFTASGDSSRPGTHVWDVASGRELGRFDASAAGFSADGRTLIIGRQMGGAPALRELQTGSETPLAGGLSAIVDLALVDDGRTLAAATEHGGIRHWDLATGQLIRTFDCPGGSGTRSVSASNGGPWLAASCKDGGVHVWNLQTGKLRQTLNASSPGNFGVLAHVRFSPSGRQVAFSANEQLVVWDVTSGRELRRMTLPRAGSPFLQDIDSMEGVPEDMRQQFTEQLEQYRPTGQQTADWEYGVVDLAFHPDGRYVAVAKRDASTLLVDIDSGEVARRFTGSLAKAASVQPADTTQQTARLEQLFGGRGLSHKEKALEEATRIAGARTGGGISDALDEYDMVRSLAFSADGKVLFTLGTGGKRAWDVESGRLMVRQPAPAAADTDFDPILDAAVDASVVANESGGLAVTAVGRLAARGHGNRVMIWDVASDADVAELAGHTSDVTSLVYAANERLLVSGSRDGTVRVWSASTRAGIAELIALGTSDYVAVTPDRYYRASRRSIAGVAFRVNDRLYPFEQFDLRFNRPDIVLERLGLTSPEVVQSYRAAYHRRLKKLGFTEQQLTGELHLPEVEFVGAPIPVTTGASSLQLRVRASDPQHNLDRVNVFVNDVPVYGTGGIRIADPEAHTHEQDIEVPLVFGRNKIQISALNVQGAESLKQTLHTTSTAEPGDTNVYVLAIGVSRYRNEAYNLRFAAKDAADLVEAYRGREGRGDAHRVVHVLDLQDEKATRPAIRQAKDWLQQARVNDLVVVFAAGHGMIDASQNYYFGTHDIDPENPAVNGLPYEDFEGLLDGIRAMRKVLLIDTCFSGEIDQDEAIVLAQADAGGEGTVSMRTFKEVRGVSVTSGGTLTLETHVLRFQQELFADLRRGTGAVVISSASGNEYALEGEQWSNGVFTYALLNGLKNGHADVNRDGTILVSELQAYVIEAVRALTAGGQNPTVRRENRDYDFTVY